jgi:hypothetical protein
VNNLDQVERAWAEARDRTSGLAVMGSHELHGAVAAVQDAAAGLLAYHLRWREAFRAAEIAYIQLKQLRAQAGLPPPEQVDLAPDFGPMPGPDPGSNVITGKGHYWIALLGSLNGSDLETIARCLGELNGWKPPAAAAAPPAGRP